MPRRIIFHWICCLATVASCALATAAERWTDRQGNTFRGDPEEHLGPLALFRTGPISGTKIAWRYLTPEDCVRFHEGIKDQPARAEDWANAQGTLSHELIGRVQRVEDDKLVDASVSGRPEPEFFMLFFADDGEGKPWDMLTRSVEPFKKLQDAFPGMVAGLFFGAHHSATDHLSMATRLKMPWLVAEYHEQFRHLPELLRCAPTNQGDYTLMVVNRDGVPLFSSQSPNDDDREKIFAELAELLDLMRPENTRGWPDRLYYLRAVQPAVYAHGRCDPVMVGNPLMAEGLRQRKIYQVDASIAVDREGHATEVTIQPDGHVPADMVAPLADALRRTAVFAPAVDNGRFVAGTCAYHLKIAP